MTKGFDDFMNSILHPSGSKNNTYSWIDRHGNFYPNTGGSSHAETGRRLLLQKFQEGKLSQNDYVAARYNVYHSMYGLGYARVTQEGRDLTINYLGNLTPAMQKSLINVAIENRLDSVVQDDETNRLKIIWKRE